MADTFDLVVIGAGPGGYIAAIRAAQLGMAVACIEREKALGGTCLRVGCIPSKALLESSERFEATKDDLKKHGVKVGGVELDLGTMMKRKDATVTALTKGVEGLFKKNKVTRYEGTGTIKDANTVAVGDTTLKCKYIIIATGSVPSMLRGVEFDGDLIGDSTTALAYPEVPKHLVVIGGGVIGLELGSVWRRLGSKVTVLEYMDQILLGMDGDLCAEALKLFKKQGMEFHLGAKVTGASPARKGGGCTVTAEGMDDIKCDRVLLSVGRKPNTEGLGL
jgi:dihydrolipoamide dehydrogenase